MMLQILGISTPMPNILVVVITRLAPINHTNTPALSNYSL